MLNVVLEALFVKTAATQKRLTRLLQEGVLAERAEVHNHAAAVTRGKNQEREGRLPATLNRDQMLKKNKLHARTIKLA